MEHYEIEFQPSVRKDFRKLSPDNASRILPKIEELATDPSHKYLSNKLPDWINMAIDTFMASLIKRLFFIVLICLIDQTTGNSLSHWAMANVETKAFVDKLHTAHGNLLHLIKS